MASAQGDAQPPAMIDRFIERGECDFDSIRYRSNPAVRGPISLPIRSTPAGDN